MSELPVIGERCENLRWKGLYLDDSPAAQPAADSILWCLTTQICLGPDGKPVDRYECNPSRPCYRAV